MRNETAAAPGHRVHLLGFTTDRYLRFWRPFSCDTSAFLSSERFGALSLYFGFGDLRSFSRAQLTPALLREAAPRVARYGLDIYRLRDPGEWRGIPALVNLISTCAYLDLSLDYARGLGVNYFLSAWTAHSLARLFDAFARVRALYAQSDPAPQLRLLTAYPYFTNETARLLNQNAADLMLLIDSGAFTAWKARKPIALDDYCRFLETLAVRPWRYFQLDVVGDAAATVANYDEMRRRGFDPAPIFTRGADLAVLDYFFEQTNFVGIGGLVQTRGNNAFVNGVMARVQGLAA